MVSNIQLNIHLNLQQLVATIQQLSPAEKLLINSALWEGNMEIPTEHQSLVLDRVKNARQNPDRLLDWEEASKKLRP